MANFTPQELEEILQAFFDVTGKRQYIGARYVPIFGRKNESSIEWDNLAPYESLTVVMHNGISYVSRKYVPAGIEITDTEFWAETYRFNAQVEQYRQEVLGFQDQIDAIRDDMESDYIPFPDSDTYPKYGTSGQVLTTLANGATKWEDPVTVDATIAEPLIEAWLDEHPEATTTVQDNSLTLSKLANAAYNALSPLKVITPISRVVEIDTTANTITFPTDTVIVGATYRYTIESDTVVDLTATTSRAKYVSFDTVNHTFLVRAYSTNSTRDCQVICAMRYNTGFLCHVDASFPFTVDGVPYNLNINDLAANRGIGPDLLALRIYNLTTAPRLIVPRAGWVDFDLTNKTITFPSDTVVALPFYRYALPNAIVVDMTTMTSSAVKIVFNIDTHEISLISYNTNTPVDCINLAAYRYFQNDTYIKIDASFPFSVNGNPYNIVIPSALSFDTIVGYIPNHVKSVNHRGYTATAPENTLPAFIESKKRGFEYVETDVLYTSDNVPVLLHDGTINRTARNDDGTEITETINIADITYAQALTYDFGIWKGSQYAGTRIPTLDQFLKLCRDLSLKPYLELKGGNAVQARMSDIVASIKRYGMVNDVTCISQSILLLQTVASLNGNIRLGFVGDTASQSVIDDMLAIKSTHGNDVFMDISYADTNAPTLCIQNDIPLESWTISEANIASVDDYVTGITTNGIIASKYYYDQYIG